MSLIEFISDSSSNPLQVVEDIAAGNSWAFERSGDNEITILVKGRWTDYQVCFTWMGEIEALHLACTFDMKIPDARRAEVQRLVALINEQLWIGHFDIWSSGGVLLYRHGLLLGDDGLLSLPMAQLAVESAVAECDRFYPAFQFVLWGDKKPKQALEAALVDAAGEA
jgi:hypothetical protein